LRSGLEPEAAAGLFLTSVFGFLMLNQDSPSQRQHELDTLVSLYLEAPQHERAAL
jgi:hypothetical protein